MALGGPSSLALGNSGVVAASNLVSAVDSAGIAGTPVTLTLKGNPVRYDITNLYHYTNEVAMNGIINSKELWPSLWYEGTKDVRYGNGQYLTDIAPGTMSPANIARNLIGVPNKYKFTNYVQIDTSGLRIIQGRSGVFVVPNDVPLDVSSRILNNGKLP